MQDDRDHGHDDHGHDGHDDHDDGHDDHPADDPRWVLASLAVGLVVGVLLVAVLGLDPDAAPVHVL